MRKVIAVLASAGLMAFALSGCAPEPEPTKTPSASSTASTEQTDEVAEESAEAAGIDLTDLGAPVATAEVPIVVDGDPEATMTVAFYGLERDGETVIATYSFTAKTSEEGETSLFAMLGDSNWEPFLIDPVNLAKHSVVKAAGAGTANTPSTTRMTLGQTYYAYAVFAAPPSGVDEMNAALVDGAPLAIGVPVP